MRELEHHHAGGAGLDHKWMPGSTVRPSVPSISNGDGVVAVLLHDLRQRIGAWLRNREARAGILAMSELDDKMLDDIGLVRDEVDHAVRKADAQRAMRHLRQVRHERIHCAKRDW